MKNIGDVVWIARLKHKEFTETCPDCLGKKTVTLALENGEKHFLECHTCHVGGIFGASRGYVTKAQYQATAEQRTINSMEVSSEKTTYRFFDWSCDEVFDSQEMAVAAAEKIRVEKEDDDHKRFAWKKEDSRRTWAWNCSYYRRQIKDAEKQIAWASARLGICKAKAKEPAEVKV